MIRKVRYVALAVVALAILVLAGALGAEDSTVAYAWLDTPVKTTVPPATETPSSPVPSTPQESTPTSPPEWTATPRFDTETPPAPTGTVTPAPDPTATATDQPGRNPRATPTPNMVMPQTGGGMPPHVQIGLTAICMIVLLFVAGVARRARA